MAKLIVGIHGLANKPPRNTLAGWWEKSIREGLRKNENWQEPLAFRMVYWADLLYKYPAHDDADFSFDALYNAEPYVEARPGALKEYKDTWLDDFRAATLDVFGSVADFAKQYLHFDPLQNRLLGKIVRDLAFYYDPGRQIRNRAGQREMARKVLEDELKSVLVEEKAQELMLIAHSMGSIIAYNVLRDLGRENSGVGISHLITIGSPLGFPLVKAKIVEERGYDPRVRTPTIVRSKWLNFADRRDPVAVDIHLRDDYGANAAGVRAVDDLISNDYEAPESHHRNFHKSYGYLRAPELSRQIKSFLAS